MSLKNDRWILFMCERHKMIEPFERVQCSVADHGKVLSYGPSSFGYDVRAGEEWKIFTDVLGAVVDPKKVDERAFHTLRAVPGEPVILPPNSYALTHSLEYIRVPPNVSCVCLGKSTYARCGIHVNITPLEAGWEGQITIEISNGTRLPVKIYPGEGIAQILFFEGEQPAVTYADRNGKYQGQRGVVLAKMLECPDEAEVLPKATHRLAPARAKSGR